MTPTEDRKRIDVAETNIGVLQSDARATAALLEGVARTLEKLTAGQYPPFSDVLRNFAAGCATASILLGGYFWLTSIQVQNATAPLHARIERLEAAIAWTPSFVTIRKGE